MLVNNTCSLINNMIAGTVHVAANLALNVAIDTVNTFKDICTGHDATASAEKLGKDLFVYTTGMNYDDVAKSWRGCRPAPWSIFSPAIRRTCWVTPKRSASITLKVIQNNPYIQMAGTQLSAYNGQMTDLLGIKPGDAVMVGFLGDLSGSSNHRRRIMTDNAKPNGNIKVPEPGSADSAIQGLSMIFGASVKQLVANAESQQVAILALTSMLALLPGVAEIDPKRLAVVVQALTQGRKDADQVRERIAAYVSMVVTMANKLPEVIAEADAKAKADGH